MRRNVAKSVSVAINRGVAESQVGEHVIHLFEYCTIEPLIGITDALIERNLWDCHPADSLTAQSPSKELVLNSHHTLSILLSM
jgi:hypothetical protein